MVDAAGGPRQRAGTGEVQVISQFACGVLGVVAQADVAQVRRTGDRHDDRSHRVCLVEEPRIRGLFLDHPRQSQDLRYGAGRPRDTPDPMSVSDRLADAISLGDVEVQVNGAPPADGHRIDDVAGAPDRLSAIVCQADPSAGPAFLDDHVHNFPDFFQSLGVDVHQPDLSVRRRLLLHEVAHQLPGEHQAPRSDHCDLHHRPVPFLPISAFVGIGRHCLRIPGSRLLNRP